MSKKSLDCSKEVFIEWKHKVRDLAMIKAFTIVALLIGLIVLFITFKFFDFSSAAENLSGVVTVFLHYVADNPRVWGSIVALLTVFIGYRQLNILKKQRYINAINEERIRWINDLRVTFNKYLSNVRELKIKWSGELDLQKKIDEHASYIYLLTNPNEKHIKELYELMDLFSDKRLKNKLCFLEPESTPNKNNSAKEKKGYALLDVCDQIEATEIIMQVILKAEWKIIKEETKKGKEKNGRIKEKHIDKTMESIKENSNLNNLEKKISEVKAGEENLVKRKKAKTRKKCN